MWNHEEEAEESGNVYPSKKRERTTRVAVAAAAPRERECNADHILAHAHVDLRRY